MCRPSTSATVKLLDGGNLAAPATMTYDQATRTATLTPTSPLANGMTYTIFVAGGSAGVRDMAGNPMAQNTTSSFSTALGSARQHRADDHVLQPGGRSHGRVDIHADQHHLQRDLERRHGEVEHGVLAQGGKYPGDLDAHLQRGDQHRHDHAHGCLTVRAVVHDLRAGRDRAA